MNNAQTKNTQCRGGCGKVRSILFSDSPADWICFDCGCTVDAEDPCCSEPMEDIYLMTYFNRKALEEKLTIALQQGIYPRERPGR
jgi:hypothetical protein